MNYRAGVRKGKGLGEGSVCASFLYVLTVIYICGREMSLEEETEVA